MTAIFDRKLLRTRRIRAAANAGKHDFLLRHVAAEMAERLSVMTRDFKTALVTAPAPRLISKALRGAGMAPDTIEVDLILHDLPQEDNILPVIADDEFLPLAPSSLDLIVSGLNLHFVNDVPGALIQAKRSLQPDGLFMAAVLGGSTLFELREAFLLAEEELQGGASPHVVPFADVRDFGALLQRAGFALPVVDSDSLKVRYSSPFSLMHELRGMAATNILLARHKMPLRRQTLFRMAEIYQQKFSSKGRVTATFEIIYLTGWAPDVSQPKPLRPGSAKMRLAEALGTNERKFEDK